MKMLDLSRLVAEMSALALFYCLCGCSPAVETPNSSVFATAMEDYQAGNYDAAIAGFRQVLKNDPKDNLAHFQLAVALQDKKNDYLGALVHYSLYLELRPSDDKTTHVKDRMRECKDKLVKEHAGKADNASARKDGASGKGSSADEDKKNAAEITRLKAEVALLKKQRETLYNIIKAGETGKGSAPLLNNEAKKLLAELRVSETEERSSKTIIPTDTELLDDDGGDGSTLSSSAVQKQLDEMEREDSSGSARPKAIQKPNVPANELSGSGQPPPIKKSQLVVNPSTGPDLKPGAVQGGGKNVLIGDSKKPSGAARPDMYKVQPKETLSDIAERFYGSRNKWRDIQRANAATVDIDGRVKAGQVIKLP